MHEFFGEPIDTYTRAEALADGALVDVTKTAQEAGFVFPVALTARVWADVNDIPPKQSHQDVDGRLFDLVFMAAFTCKKSSGKRGGDAGGLPFDLIMHVGRKTYYRAKVHLGPGDDMEPVITIMAPDES